MDDKEKHIASKALEAACQKVFEVRPTKAALAEALGISKQAVQQWEWVPEERVVEVEEVTGVDRSLLRPDLYRNLSEEERANEVADELERTVSSIRRRIGLNDNRNFYDPSGIARARELMAMTQSEFAEWLGDISASTICNWERGERCPSLKAEQCIRNKIRSIREEVGNE